MGFTSSNYYISEVLYRLNVGASIELDILKKAFLSILTDEKVKARDTQLGALLSGIMVKGPTADEVVELIKVALSVDRYRQISVTLPRNEILVGVAGSGKKGVKTMNISTPACIVAASGGAYVAKPGSSSTSSVSGSADFVKSIGLNFNDFDSMVNALTETGIGFFSIEGLIPRFDTVYGQRMFGPNPLSFAFPVFLCPISCDVFLYGLSHPNIGLSLEVFAKLDVQNVLVVCSTDDNIHFIDELGLFGHNYVGGINKGIRGKVVEFNPMEELEIPRYNTEEISAAPSMLENIRLALNVIRGKYRGPREDIIAINAGAILYLAGKVANRKEGFCLARQLIRDGVAFSKLIHLVESFGSGMASIEMLIGKEV